MQTRPLTKSALLRNLNNGKTKILSAPQKLPELNYSGRTKETGVGVREVGWFYCALHIYV